MLTPQDLATIQADLGGLAVETERPIRFYRFTGRAPGDKAAGMPSQPVYDPTDGMPLTAVVYPVMVEQKDAPGGRIATGEVAFRLRRAICPDRPKPEDRIVWQGSWYVPGAIDEVWMGGGVAWTVKCRLA